MATSRVSAMSMSRRIVTVCRPRLQLAIRCTAVARPSLKPVASIHCAKYSTAVEQPSLAPKIERGASKLFKNADEAVADIKSGSTILSAGFGLCGVAGREPLIHVLKCPRKI